MTTRPKEGALVAPITLPLKSITIDPSIQQRVEMDPALVAEYQTDIGDWIQAAPVVAFGSNGLYWLADGFHRVCAADEAGLVEIPVIVHQGGRNDALKYALGANARHGKRRSAGDLAKAYRRAVAEQMLDPGDVEAVASLLNCSRRAASDLTREVREQVNAERDAAIQRLAEEGKTIRQIAAETGASKSTVDRLVPKRNASKMGQADEIQHDPEVSAEASAPAPAPKGPTAKDAMHVMLHITGGLGALRHVEEALLPDDAAVLIKELRKALGRLVERFEGQVEGSDHA